MKISVRQICFILATYTVVTKLLLYPILLSEFSGRDLVFSALISFIVQGAVIWAVAFLCSKTDKTLYELIKDNLGEVAARIVYGFFAAFFIFCSIAPMFEQKLYVQAIFYDTVPSFIIFAPVFLFTVYAGSKGLKNIGRCADICMPVFVISILFIFLMSFSEVDFSNLLPVFRTSATSVLGGSLKTYSFFLEPAYMLMFLGNFKYKRGDALKLTLSYVIGALTVLFFLAVFYGIYGELTSSRQFAVSKTSLYFSAMDIVGRVDLYALYTLEIVMLFAFVLNIQFAVHCLVKCSGWNCPEFLSLFVNLALFAIIITCEHYLSGFRNFLTDWAWIIILLFATAAPLCAWAFRRDSAPADGLKRRRV